MSRANRNPQHPSATLRLGYFSRDVVDQDRLEIDLRRPHPGLHSATARRLLDLPTLEQLRASGKVPATCGEEAFRRYQQECIEYAEDVHAYVRVLDEDADRMARSVCPGVTLINAGPSPATGVTVRFTFPVGLVVETDASPSVRLLQPQRPLPLTAPPHERRRRFDPRPRAEPPPAGEVNRWSMDVARDGATVLTHDLGTVQPDLKGQLLRPTFTVVFPTWERVASLVVAYEIHAQAVDLVRGELRVHLRVRTEAQRTGDLLRAVAQLAVKNPGELLSAGLAILGSFRGGPPRPPEPQRQPAPPMARPGLVIPPDPPLGAGRAVYRAFIEQGGVLEAKGGYTVTVSRTDVEDGAAWRVVNEVDAEGLPISDEVVMRARDLRPISHEGGMWAVRYAGTVVGDVLYAETSLWGVFQIPLPESAFLSDPCLWMALAACPLDREWSATVHPLRQVEGSRSPRFISLRLRVIGEERVAVPAGEFACWIVSAEGGAEATEIRETYWVSLGDPSHRVVVRARQRLAGPPPIRQLDLFSLERADIRTGA